MFKQSITEGIREPDYVWRRIQRWAGAAPDTVVATLQGVEIGSLPPLQAPPIDASFDNCCAQLLPLGADGDVRRCVSLFRVWATIRDGYGAIVAQDEPGARAQLLRLRRHERQGDTVLHPADHPTVILSSPTLGLFMNKFDEAMTTTSPARDLNPRDVSQKSVQVDIQVEFHPLRPPVDTDTTQSVWQRWDLTS